VGGHRYSFDLPLLMQNRIPMVDVLLKVERILAVFPDTKENCCCNDIIIIRKRCMLNKL